MCFSIYWKSYSINEVLQTHTESNSVSNDHPRSLNRHYFFLAAKTVLDPQKVFSLLINIHYEAGLVHTLAPSSMEQESFAKGGPAPNRTRRALAGTQVDLNIN